MRHQPIRTPASINRTGPHSAAARRGRRRRAFLASRRGVSSVLAMMFMVVFSSLAAVMAVVAQGNLRTAESGLQLSRAMSAAETGLVFAARRLKTQSARFVIEKGVIDADYADELWNGTYDEAADGDVSVLPPTGFTESTPPSGLVEAVRNAHLADSDDFQAVPGDATLPEIDEVGTLRVRPIHVTADAASPYFRLKYEMVSSQPFVRVTSQGVDGDITRTLQLDYKISKRIDFAVLSPNRIMIGKNVRIEGPLGSRFGIHAGELAGPNSHPLVMRSDFYFLAPALDTKLDTYFTQLQLHDADGDGRLRPDHPGEAQGLTGQPSLVDADGDQYVDDFDLYLAHFDTNSDARVCYDPDLAAAAGLGGMSNEFENIDNQLARLIDDAYPDRDGDGDVDSSDVALGYHDGVIDINDVYAKVHGRLAFAVARSTWETALTIPTYQRAVSGPIRTNPDEAPVTFEVPDADMHEVTTDMISDSETFFDTATAGSNSFANQVTSGLGSGGIVTDPSAATWEDVPYGAQQAGGAPYDWYQRRIYDHFTFTNVRIPKGTNALFKNCTFVGVTYVETETNCIHENWNYAGSVTQTIVGGVPTYPPHFTLPAAIGGVPVPDTKVVSNNLRFHNCTFLGSLSGQRPQQYTHWRNKIQLTGQTRFFIDPNDSELASEPDAATLIDTLNGISEDDRHEMEKSSILMAGWSIDVGNFNNVVDVDPSATPKVRLKGTIIAGILDIRGTADVHGTLLMTYRPVAGEGPLFYGGLPDAFNTTIGYFGPADGDGEGVDAADATFTGYGEITLRYDPNALLPDGIPWPISMELQPLTYTEGGSI